MKYSDILIAVCMVTCSLNQPLLAQEKEPAPLALEKQVSVDQAEPSEEYAGELFGMPVPMHNYFFIQSVLAVFGTRDGRPPEKEEERQEYIWDNLLLSLEAFRREIEVSQEEVESEVSKILEAEKAVFDWKNEPQKYSDWVKERIGIPIELFESQIRHLLQVEKLKSAVRESITPEVSDQEMFEEFLNEYNTLGLELVEFEDLKHAEDFYRKAKRNSRFWEAFKKKEPKRFRRPGFVSLEFLIDIWKIPKEVCYAMMKFKEGEAHPPAPIYKGYGVFKMIEKRQADEKEYGKLKDSYYNQIKRRKQYEGYGTWFKTLKEQANIKIYKQEGGGKE